jgi:hypothetical protein
LRIRIEEYIIDGAEFIQKTLNEFAENYNKRTKIKTQIKKKGEKTELFIEFLTPDSFFELHERESTVLNIMISKFLQCTNEQTDRFDFIERFNKFCENDDYYLVVKYQTDLIKEFSEYYTFINRFTAIFNILIFIEDQPDGFKIYFGRKQDYEYFTKKTLTIESLSEFSEKENLDFKDIIFDKILDMIRTETD